MCVKAVSPHDVRLVPKAEITQSTSGFLFRLSGEPGATEKD